MWGKSSIGNTWYFGAQIFPVVWPQARDISVIKDRHGIKTGTGYINDQRQAQDTLVIKDRQGIRQ